MQAPENKTFLSATELAAKLGISRVAVFKRIQKNQIPAKKIGGVYIISLEDVHDLLQSSPQKITVKHGKQTVKKREEIITKAVKKLVKEYGETLRLLGKE
jgi:excisionase family DNA binding protein